MTDVYPIESSLNRARAILDLIACAASSPSFGIDDMSILHACHTADDLIVDAMNAVKERLPK